DGELFWPHVEALMRSMPPSISGDGGHDRLFDAACTLRSSFRLTFEASMRALRIFNQRCKPPWSEAELAHKVEQAAHDKTHKPGSLVPPEAQERLREAAGYVQSPEPPPEEPWAPAALLVGLVTRVEYLCKDLGIRDGRPSLWTADARCGKSTLAASVALAVASGRKLWGKLDVVQGDVCYVAGEGMEGIGRMWRRLALDQRITIPPSLHVTNQIRLAGPLCDEAKLRRVLESHKLVIFDTLRSLSREAGIEENDPRFADGLYLLDRVSQGTGCCMVVLHHNNRSGNSNGTAALFGAAGNHLAFNRDEEKGSPLTCYAVGTRDGLKIPSFELEMKTRTKPPPPDDPDSDGMRFEYRAKQNASRSPNVERLSVRLYERLQKADKWLTRTELLHDLPGKRADIQTALSTLEERIGFKLEGR